MKPVLSENDKIQLDKRISEAEKITKTQIVLATVNRSDSFVEIPWKAFALGTSITGLLVFLLDVILIRWNDNTTVLISIVVTLAAGVIIVLMTLLFPGFARLFLSASRMEMESRQYAESLFLSRELFSTTHRRGILLLISRFERVVVILADKGLTKHFTKDEIKSIISLMKKPLAKNELKKAMEIALDEFIRVIEPLSSDEPVNDELSNKIIEEEGL